MEKIKSKKKKSRKMEKIVSNILVVSDYELKPYIEMLDYTPENVTHKSLGRLLGFFEIKDENEDSAYIVNFLASVAKKEYFINTKRGPIESFEAVLNKINLALAEIAKHGNVNWLGKLDSALCAIEENNLHFSVSGNGKVLLMRNGNLTEISQGLAEKDNAESDYLNPMKTFVNVSSGRLEDKDKIIITTDDIFQIFSLNEIKRGALQFSQEKFIQFIKTALINELDIAGTIIIDIRKKIIEAKESVSFAQKMVTEENEKELNVFSSKIFEEKNNKKHILEKTNNTSKSVEKENDHENKIEYTDEKTKHIYLKEDPIEIPIKKDMIEPLKEFLREKFLDFSYWLKNDFRRLTLQTTKKIVSNYEKYSQILKKIILQAISQWKEKKKSNLISQQSYLPEKSTSAAKTRTFSSLFQKIKSNVKITIPNFGKIKLIVQKMTYSQKIYSILILLAIIILPLFFQNNPQSLPDTPREIEADTSSFALSEEKNIQPIDLTKKIFSSEKSPRLTVESDGRLFFVFDEKIIEFTPENNRESASFDLPEFGSQAKIATFMPDLHLILILTEQKEVISFNTISRKFQQTNFTAPEGAQIADMETYLTYLYLLDSANDQVYIYPRAEGGFSEKEPRLKETFDIQSSDNMTIDGNIYISSEEKILSFFQGKKTELNLEQSKTSIKNNLIFTSQANNFIYSIDKENGRLVKFTKQGEITKQYYSEKIKITENFTVNGNDTKAYISMPDGIYQLDI